MTKTKLNDKVNSKKSKKKVDIDKVVSEEANEAKRFVIILLSIIILILAVYGITRLIDKNKDDESSSKEVTAGEIDYDKVSVGTLFNRREKEYYVIAYDGEDANAIYYSALINKYMKNENALKIYFCDLSNELNKKYYVGEDGESNQSATSPSELALKDVTLIKIKGGKIVKYLETLDTIKTELGV